MSFKNDLKEQLDKLMIERKNLHDQIENNRKNQVELCNLINKSAIFDETIIFNIAQLLSYKDERKPFVPFTYKRYTIAFGENLEEIYIGIAPDNNIISFIRNGNDSINDFFKSNLGFEIFKKKADIVDLADKEGIINFYNFYDGENDRSKIIFEFLLDDYNIKNSYPTAAIPVSLCNFEDYEYVRDYISYLFELQLKNNGRQLSNDEMHQALNDFLELGEEKVKKLSQNM